MAARPVVGFCWGVSMFAPFALLGELILADSTSHHGGGADAYALRSQSSVSLRRPLSRSRPQSRRTSEDSTASGGGDEWHEAEGLMRKGVDDGPEALPSLPPSPPLSSGPSSRSSSESSDDGRHKVEIRYSNSTLSLPRRPWPSSERVDDDGEADDVDGRPSEDAFAADLEGPRKGGGTAEKAGVILVSSLFPLSRAAPKLTGFFLRSGHSQRLHCGALSLRCSRTGCLVLTALPRPRPHQVPQFIITLYG